MAVVRCVVIACRRATGTRRSLQVAFIVCLLCLFVLNTHTVVDRGGTQASDTDALSPDFTHDNNTISLLTHTTLLADIEMQPQPVRLVWSHLPRCSHHSIRFAAVGQLPAVAVTSYPGSGNTWTRRLLELATGVFTGSVYDDNTLYYSGFLGEKSDPFSGTTIVQKDHGFDLATMTRFNRSAVVVVRNPYRAIISYHNFMYGGHTGMAPSKKYLTKSWNTFVKKQLLHWSRHLQAWVAPENRVLVVHYELLKNDPVGQLKRMLDFIGWPVDENRLHCVREDLRGEMQRHIQHRPRQLPPFSEPMRRVIDRLILDASAHLRRACQPDLPLHLYEFFNHSELRSEALEDCSPGESLHECAARVDVMNRPSQIKALLEQTRVSLRSSLDATGVQRVLDSLGSTWQLLRPRQSHDTLVSPHTVETGQDDTSHASVTGFEHKQSIVS